MREKVYQFSSVGGEINFFTTSAEQRDQLLNSDRNFDFLGTSFLGADPANEASQPVFTLFNQSTGEYFYTLDADERDELLSDNDFSDRGTAFSAFDTAGTGRTPIYQLQNTATGVDIFTPSAASRQSLLADEKFTDEGIGIPFYTLAIAGTSDTPPSEDPIDSVNTGTGSISGLVFSDRNRSGVRDSELVQGENPDLIFTLDVSGSTGLEFAGTSVGDVNGDGREDTILDAELAGLIALNQLLQSQGLGDNVEIGIVIFGTSGLQLNMIPGAEDSLDPVLDADTFEFTISPNTDSNDNDISDVEEVLSSITSSAFGVGSGTNFRDALLASEQTLNAIGTTLDASNIIFLSDGEAFITDEDEALVNLRSNNVNISAFGVGGGADLVNLRVIDPLAQIFTSTDEFLEIFGVTADGDDDSLSMSRLEPPRGGVQVYIDSNNNGTLDSDELIQTTDTDGQYQFTNLEPGEYVIRQVLADFEQTSPAEGEYTIELAEGEAESEINFGTAPIFRDNFSGADIQVQAFSPDRNTPITSRLTSVVGEGVEFADLPANALDDAEVIDVNINVGSSRVIFTVDELAADDDGIFDPATFRGFNGYRLLDISQSIAPIVGIRIDPSSTLAVSEFNVDFNSDLIEVDFSGVSYTPGDSLILNVEFASDQPILI